MRDELVRRVGPAGRLRGPLPRRPAARGLRRWAAHTVAVLLLAGCSSAPPDVPPTLRPSTYDLPFGLRQVEGTGPVGRPVSYEDVLVEFRGEPVRGRRLRAAYVVSGDDPVAVFGQWVDQLAGLPLDELSVRPGDAELGQWLVATGGTDYRPDEPFGAFAELQLWTTGAGPVLLVDVSVRPGARPARPSPAVVPAAPRPSTEVPDGRAEAGDVMFTEQGQSVHLPAGTRALVPTLPTPSGTGGSSSVLAAPDADAAVQALLDEARTRSDDGEVRGPTATVEDGVRVVRASFVIPAGGWGFDVVAARGEGDASATVVVTSSADQRRCGRPERVGDGQPGPSPERRHPVGHGRTLRGNGVRLRRRRTRLVALCSCRPRRPRARRRPATGEVCCPERVQPLLSGASRPDGSTVQIQGIVFAGTGTAARREMTAFVRDVLGLTPAYVTGVEADLFDLPDGSSFAVASPEGMGATDRTLGFLVDDLQAAVEELRAAGVEVDDVMAGNARERYVHFRAPDGQLYELLERRT